MSWQTIEFGIDDRGFGKECQTLEELREYLATETIDGRALGEGSAVELIDELVAARSELAALKAKAIEVAAELRRKHQEAQQSLRGFPTSEYFTGLRDGHEISADLVAVKLGVEA